MNAKTVNVQFGCGLTAPSDWINFDVSPTLRFRRWPLVGKLVPSGKFGEFPPNVLYGDITLRLPISPGTVDFVYCSHVLEHLSRDDFVTSIFNVFEMLKPGGVFRFVLPDLEFLAKSYLEKSDSDACDYFMEESYLGRRSRSKSLMAKLRDMLGNSRHLWMWDFKGMRSELTKIGFVALRRAQFGDSEHVCFASVEERKRWDNQLGVECQKPQ